MKTICSALRIFVISAALLLYPLVASTYSAKAIDAPASQLAHAGSIQLVAVGPYVECGTFRVQVAVKLGQPSSVLPDGTWLYRGYVVDDSQAAGTLVVRFKQGRVSELSLATPPTIVALRRTLQNSDRNTVASTEANR